MLAAGVVLVWFIVAVFADVIAPYEPNAHNLKEILQSPNWAHWLGTDNFGRDVLSRIIHGTRIDLQMGIVGVALPFIIGTMLGAIAGYFGGIVDNILMRILDVVLAFPWLVLLDGHHLAAGARPHQLLHRDHSSSPGSPTRGSCARRCWFSRTATSWWRRATWATATRASCFRHILPNALVPSIVFSMSDVVLVILAGSAISYLGLGVQPPTAEWGVMIAEGAELHLHRLVDDHLPRARHRLPRSRFQPSRRRPRRETRHQGVMVRDPAGRESGGRGGDARAHAARAVDGVTLSLDEGEVCSAWWA